MNTLFTIGHSNHSIEKFLNILSMHSIEAVCDVRSSPYSSYNQHFNREILEKTLKNNDIAYVYLGDALGPSSDDPACCIDGKVQYSLLAKTEIFQNGIDRLRKGLEKYRIAMMCSEKDPVNCHRMILVCRNLPEGIQVKHIMEDGTIENNSKSEIRLAKSLEKKLPMDLVDTREDIIQKAYDVQGEKIAYTPESKDN